MNRISIRGAGIAAAAMVATSLAVGSQTLPADAQEMGSSIPQTTPFVLSLFSTNGHSVLAVPYATSGSGAWESGSAELVLIHDARSQGLVELSVQGRAVAAKIAAARAAAARKAARERAIARASRAQIRPVVPGSLRALGQKMAAARGWTGSQWQCLDNIWMRESGWSKTAANPSGAYGIPQASPGSKMASAGADWQTNPATQITWGLSYIANAYGNPCSAWAFWQTHYWY
jgi:uncharacterized protein YdbL (DUF1318 family)